MEQFLGSIWALVTAILISSVPSVWALILASKKYNQERGKENADANASASYIKAAIGAAEYAKNLLSTIQDQGAKMKDFEAEIHGLKVQYEEDIRKLRADYDLQIKQLSDELQKEKEVTAKQQKTIDRLSKQIKRSPHSRERSSDQEIGE